MRIALLSIPLFFFLSLSCEKEDKETLPPETMKGKHTFGCYVNGELWRNGKSALFSPSLWAKYDTNYLKIAASDRSKSDGIIIILNEKINPDTYYLVSPNGGEYSIVDSSDACFYATDSINSNGFVTITHLDTTNEIVSGVFEFDVKFAYGYEEYENNKICDTSTIRITEGRFDINYRR